MNGYSHSDRVSLLALEQQSWVRQIDHCLQSVAQSAQSARNGSASDREDAIEGCQVLERALRLGAEVLQALPPPAAPAKQASKV